MTEEWHSPEGPDHPNEMSIQVYLHHEHDPGRLEDVMHEMQTLGSPTVRVFCLGSRCFVALEGVHRLTAAHRRGVIPNLVVQVPACFDEPWLANEHDITAEFLNTTVGAMYETAINHYRENDLPSLIFGSANISNCA